MSDRVCDQRQRTSQRDIRILRYQISILADNQTNFLSQMNRLGSRESGDSPCVEIRASRRVQRSLRAAPPHYVPGEVTPPRCPSESHGSKWGAQCKSAAMPWRPSREPSETLPKALRQSQAGPHGARSLIFWGKIANGGSRFSRDGPETLRDDRMVEAPDDWGGNVALTRSQHLIDGSLSLDGFRSGWMAA